MSASNFNYFYNFLDFPTGNLLVEYDFAHPDSGNTVPNTALGYSGQFDGNLDFVGNFYQTSGSGFFTGQKLTINSDMSQTGTDFFTMMFCYEKTGTGGGVLFSSLGLTDQVASGFNVGINDANAMYFETFGANGPVTITSRNNFSHKNLAFVSKFNNTVGFNYYNPNLHTIESEYYSLGATQVLPSTNWNLGNFDTQEDWAFQKPFLGYLDQFVYIDQVFNNQDFVNTLSGFFTTGINEEFLYETQCSIQETGQAIENFLISTGITGYTTSGFPIYQDLVNNKTGYIAQQIGGFSGYDILGYSSLSEDSCDHTVFSQLSGIIDFSYLGDAGSVDPDSLVLVGSGFVQIPLTGGIYETGLVSLSGEVCEQVVTGQINQYFTDNGFLLSLGMSSISLTKKYPSLNAIQVDFSSGQPGVNYFNRVLPFNFDQLAFVLPDEVGWNTGTQLYVNGLAQISGGFQATGNIYTSGNVLFGDYAVFDDLFLNSTGFYQQSWYAIADNLGLPTSSGLRLSGQSSPIYVDHLNENSFLFYNGQKMIKELDFYTTGTSGFIFDTGSNFYDVEGRYYVFNQLTPEISFNLILGFSGSGLEFSGSGLSINYPYALQSNFNLQETFLRGTSRIWLNGARQAINFDYIEGSRYDLRNNAVGQFF